MRTQEMVHQGSDEDGEPVSGDVPDGEIAAQEQNAGKGESKGVEAR